MTTPSSIKGNEIETEATDLSRLKIDWRRGAPSPEMRPRRRFGRVALIAVALLLLAGVTWWFSNSPVTVRAVTVSSVDPSRPEILFNATGYVVAQRMASVASKGTGRLVDLRVREGDRVREGEIIAQLESADVAAALARAQANLKVAEAARLQAEAESNDARLAHERNQSLLDAQLLPQAAYDASEARLLRARAQLASAAAGIRAAEAEVRAAEVEVENTIIRAPFDGTVLTKNAEIGEVVVPFGSSTLAKAAVVTIADMASLQVEVDVSESNIEKIRPGIRSEIILDALPEVRYPGEVQTIVPTADRAKATVLTKIRFLELDRRVLPEMSARVAFFGRPPDDGGGPPRVAVPPGAVVRRGEQTTVFRIQGERVESVSVEVGGTFQGLLEIRQGLRPDERVVLDPPDRLSSGDRIRIADAVP